MGDWVNKPPGQMRLCPVCINGTNNKGVHTKVVARFLRVSRGSEAWHVCREAYKNLGDPIDSCAFEITI